MKFKKFKSAINSKGEYILTKYFNDNATNFDNSIILLHEKVFKYEIPISYQPISLKPFKKYSTLLSLCINEPDLIGSIMNLSFAESEFLTEDIYSYSGSGLIKWNKIPTIQTIANAEKLYQKAKKETAKLLQIENVSQINVNQIIDLLEPLSHAKDYKDIQYIYWVLCCEIRFILQLIKPENNFNLSFGFGKEWLNLRESDLNILTLLKNTHFDDYNKPNFRSTALRILKQDQVSDSKPFTPDEEQLKIFKDFEDKHKFIARSEKMLNVFEFIRDNKDNIEILITGPTGVGKEVLAKAIHEESNRNNKKWIDYNCGSKKPETVESELFGHEKGAYTGADRQRKGIFERAHMSTLFLDEIGEMSLDMQVKFLRVLQNKEITRVGGEEVIKVNFRLVCATNIDLSQAVNMGKFRKDLFYRIKVATIEIPPLDNRKDDIPYLAKFFFDMYQIEYIPNTYKRAPKWISVESFNTLKENPWEGNVRELQSTMKVFVNSNKDVLHKLTPDMFGKLFKDKSITNQNLLQDKSVGEKIFRTDEHIIALKAFIQNGFNREKARRSINIKTRDTFKKRLQSSILQLGFHHNFNLDSMINFLIESNILNEDEKQPLTSEINYIFNSIIKSTLDGTTKEYIDPPDKPIIDNLFETRNDLVEQIKNNPS